MQKNFMRGDEAKRVPKDLDAMMLCHANAVGCQYYAVWSNKVLYVLVYYNSIVIILYLL